MKDSASNLPRKFLLPRSAILRGREQIQQLFRIGKVYREQHLDVRFLLFPNDVTRFQVAFIAGKRLGKAHERNAIRRRMKEAYRLHQHLLRETAETRNTGFHGLFIAKKAGVPYAIIEQECIRLLNRVCKTIGERDNS